MSELNKEILKKVEGMLVGYGEADLSEKIDTLCKVTQYLLEKGYEDLWVSLCWASDDAVLNVVSKGWNGEEMERDTLADAERIGAESVVVANDAWFAPTILTNNNYEDLSVHSARSEGIMAVAKDRAKHLGAYKPFGRSGDKLEFGKLVIEPMSDSWLHHPRPASESIIWLPDHLTQTNRHLVIPLIGRGR